MLSEDPHAQHAHHAQPAHHLNGFLELPDSHALSLSLSLHYQAAGAAVMLLLFSSCCFPAVILLRLLSCCYPAVILQVAACAALTNIPYLDGVRDALLSERSRLFRSPGKASAGCSPTQSQANFILCKVAEVSGTPVLSVFEYGRQP